MKTIVGNKGRLLRLWTEDEYIEDELDRTFEIVSDEIFQFEDGYPIPDRSSVMALYCQIPEGGIIQVAAVRQLSTMRIGELIWGKDKKQFTIYGRDGSVENKESLFVFLPLAEDPTDLPPGEYLSADPSLPISEGDAYEFARNFTSFFNSKANLLNINAIMADLIVWMVQMYKIAELNQENCTFAEMLQKITAEDPRFSNVVGIADEMLETPFTAEDVTNFLMEDIDIEVEEDDPEQAP